MPVSFPDAASTGCVQDAGCNMPTKSVQRLACEVDRHPARRIAALQLLALGALPLAGAIAGAWIDQRDHFGFTNWRSACRASGISLRSLVAFTFELLPTAIVGMLAGALALQMTGFVLRRREGKARLCLAAHSGCALAMPVGMYLCAIALPVPLMLIADVLLALAASSVMLRTLAPDNR